MTSSVEISYYRQDTPIIHFGDQIHDLYIVRSGEVEVYRRKGELYNRLDEGHLFGQMGLLTNNKVRFPVKATKTPYSTAFLSLSSKSSTTTTTPLPTS